jgi:homoserine dehydrogenase
MPHYNLAFIGFGNVGQALVRLLDRKRDALKSSYHITYSVTGIATGRHGCAVNVRGLNTEDAIRLLQNGQSIASLSSNAVNDPMSVIEGSNADVMFENSPVNKDTGRPAIDHIRAALKRNMHAITANKGPVVHGYRELTELAKSKHRVFGFESTVLGGAPLFSVFREAFPLAEFHSFHGILNSTTNVILSRMERGESFEDAVRYCQESGVAETDPSNDVDGWDAAIKVAALVTVLMKIPFTPQQVNPTGIRGITPGMIASAKSEGKRYKLVCSAERNGETVKASVRPELLDASSPLFHIMDSDSGVTVHTDVLPGYSITETDETKMFGSADETAYGLFADFVRAGNPLR